MNALEFWTGRHPDRLFGPWDTVSKEFDRLLQDFDKKIPRHSERDFKFPVACDVAERSDGYLLSLDVPGMKKEDIHLEVEGDVLVISGERRSEFESTEGEIHRRERHFGRFERRFQMPKDIDLENIEAHYDEGVLSLNLPKSEVTKPRKIEIGSSKPGLLRKIKSGFKEENSSDRASKS